MLARITPVPNADHDSRVYECPACGNVQTALVQFNQAPWLAASSSCGSNNEPGVGRRNAGRRHDRAHLGSAA